MADSNLAGGSREALFAEGVTETPPNSLTFIPALSLSCRIPGVVNFTISLYSDSYLIFILHSACDEAVKTMTCAFSILTWLATGGGRSWEWCLSSNFHCFALWTDSTGHSLDTRNLISNTEIVPCYGGSQDTIQTAEPLSEGKFSREYHLRK